MLDAETTLGILQFLDVPEDKMKEVYLELTSVENYLKVSKPYFIPKGR